MGLVLWFVIVPLRLRGAALLAGAGIAAALAGAWDFKTHALSAESVEIAQRTTAGHQLGVVVLVMLIVLLCAGVAVGFITDRHAPSALARRRAGATIFAVMALAALIFAGALAHSQRGLTGSISHAFNALTDPNAKPPPNTPGRLTAVASVRARYWKEALQVFEAHPVLGAGADGYRTARLRYRTETLEVRHAHGFIVQTLADLGLVGLLIALGLLLTWMAAAGRPTHPLNRRWGAWSEWLRMRSGGRPGWRSSPQPYSPERIGMLSMLCLVVVFGAHSLVDWTWYVPGDACVALLCAGWLAGRGELAGEPRSPEVTAVERPLRRGRPSRTRFALACVAIAAALLAVWTQWQPQRSEEARAQALALLATDPGRPARRRQRGLARPAVGRSPVRAGGHRAGDRQPGARTRHPAARGAPATVEPRDLAHARAIRPQEGPVERHPRAPGLDLPEPGVDRARSARQPPARSGGNPQRLHRSNPRGAAVSSANASRARADAGVRRAARRRG